MTSKRIASIHFSAAGATRKTVDALAGSFAGNLETYDLMKADPGDGIELTPDVLAVVGMPVFAGRIPPFARKRLEKIRGGGAAAIAAAVFGNRAYDDALAELTDVLADCGFRVFAAGAFIGEHSIFPKVATGRPDGADMAKIAEFAKECKKRLAAGLPETGVVAVKGNRPYLVPKPGPGLAPAIDAEACLGCGACVERCPTGALLLPEGASSVEKKSEACISCAACVKACPNGAPAFRGPQYETFAKMFEEKYAPRVEPETFFL